jgi:hypothetical protein
MEMKMINNLKMIINISMERKVIMRSLILMMINYKERRIKVKHWKISKKK